MPFKHKFVAAPGKRSNVLQNRTDSWCHDMDQLLLGTVLFTLLAFLSPTVGVYYVSFALVRILGCGQRPPALGKCEDHAHLPPTPLSRPCIAQLRLAIILAHATLETALAFMNHFPIFAATLRLEECLMIHLLRPQKLSLSDRSYLDSGGVCLPLEGEPL
jgi:phosphatidylinositol glycan class Q protein